jgi:hypothetical protein
LRAWPQEKPVVEEKSLQEFYPDAGQRLKLHYYFAHLWFPPYVKSDPARFFGYFQRGEQETTKFIQARWQMMEQELKLIPPSPPGQTVIRRVSDLQMWVELPSLSHPTEMGGTGPGEGGLHLPMAIIQMPAPEFMTHAYYIGVVLVQGEHNEGEQARPEARVFTLEKIEQSATDGRLCEWTIVQREVSHWNYGTQVAVARKEFINAVISNIEKPARIPIVSTSFHIPAADAALKEQFLASHHREMTGIRCPKCAWIPLQASQWTCTCQQVWNTFVTRGKCPNCSKQWTATACPVCKEMSPHEEWYISTMPAVNEPL